MSKAYSSNLTYAQYELLSDLIPEAKPGGRKREVDMWSVLNAIFYILVEGVRWRSLPGDFGWWNALLAGLWDAAVCFYPLHDQIVNHTVTKS